MDPETCADPAWQEQFLVELSRRGWTVRVVVGRDDVDGLATHLLDRECNRDGVTSVTRWDRSDNKTVIYRIRPRRNVA